MPFRYLRCHVKLNLFTRGTKLLDISLVVYDIVVWLLLNSTQLGGHAACHKYNHILRLINIGYAVCEAVRKRGCGRFYWTYTVVLLYLYYCIMLFVDSWTHISRTYCNCCMPRSYIALQLPDLCIYPTTHPPSTTHWLSLFFFIWPLWTLASWLSNDSFVLQGKHANHTEHLPPEGYGEHTLLPMFTPVYFLNIEGYHVMKNAFPALLPCAPGNVFLLLWFLSIFQFFLHSGMCKSRAIENFN